MIGLLFGNQRAVAQADKPGIVHDADWCILDAQHGEKWVAKDKELDAKLTKLRQMFGLPSNMDAFSRSGMSLGRMFSEPSCTPTRVANWTVRLSFRTGLAEAQATIAGDGLSGEEVMPAEVSKVKGYTASQVGKWHMGDFRQAYANEQGFMNAEFSIHQQGQL